MLWCEIEVGLACSKFLADFSAYLPVLMLAF